MAAISQTVSLSVIKNEAEANTRHQNESIFIKFVKIEQDAGATEVLVT